MRAAYLLSIVLIALCASAVADAQTRGRGRAPAPPAMKTEPAVLECPSLLGDGIKTGRSFCDVLMGRDPAGGVIIKLPPHTGPVTLTFDLHNRHTYSEELIRTKRAYRNYTATDRPLDGRQHAPDARSSAERVPNAGGSRGPGLRRRRSGRRQGRCPDRLRNDQRRHSGRGGDGQYPWRETVDRPSRWNRHFQRAGPSHRHHQQRSGAVPAGPGPPSACPTVSDRTELLSIIVPVYNEVATSRKVVDRLLADRSAGAAGNRRRGRRLDRRHGRRYSTRR